MNKRNYVIFDFETSGLKFHEGAEPLQLAAIAVTPQLTYHEIEPFEVIIKPQTPEKAEAGALKVIGPELWAKANEEGLDPKAAFNSFAEWLNRVNTDARKGTYGAPIPVGFNLKFDVDIAELYMIDRLKLYPDKDKMPFQSRGIDLWQALFTLFESDPTMERFNADAMFAAMKLSRTQGTHDAMEDVKLTAASFIRFMQFYRNCRKKMSIK